MVQIQGPSWGIGLKLFHLFIKPREKDSQKSIDDFKLIVVNLWPKLTIKEKSIIATYFGSSSQDQSIENNTKRILTRVLKLWNEKKWSANPSTHGLISDKLVALKVYSFELKYYCL